MMKPCGDCSLCCKLLEVSPLQSPAGQWCQYSSRCGDGCAIHEKRPLICRTFNCLWRQASGMGHRLKPNVCNIVFEMHRQEATVVANVDPDRPEAWQRGEAKRLILRMVKDGYTVWVLIDKDKHLLLPADETERSAWERARRIYERAGWQHRATQPTSPP